MLVDTGIGDSLSDSSRLAKASQTAGYDGIWVAETIVDPFMPLLLAANSTERIELGTSIAVAFARSPMTVAQSAWNLQAFSGGRFLLGLGSQVEAHIVRRFSMPWSHPAARMSEFVSALRAIWDTWQNGTKLSFQGDFYSHTLMTPVFSPNPIPEGPPKVFLAAVGPEMTRVAGELADGLLIHGFTTERYLREKTLPVIESALETSGRSRSDFQLAYPVFVATGRTDQELESASAVVRTQIAFYGSTPAYRKVLDLHGWGELQSELNALSKQGQWAEMGDLVDEEILGAFAVVGLPDQVIEGIVARVGDVVDRVNIYTSYQTDPEVSTHILAGLKKAGTTSPAYVS
jgi:probable F420-dependent oxidoreductase